MHPHQFPRGLALLFASVLSLSGIAGIAAAEPGPAEGAAALALETACQSPEESYGLACEARRNARGDYGLLGLRPCNPEHDRNPYGRLLRPHAEDAGLCASDNSAENRTLAAARAVDAALGLGLNATSEGVAKVGEMIDSASVEATARTALEVACPGLAFTCTVRENLQGDYGYGGLRPCREDAVNPYSRFLNPHFEEAGLCDPENSAEGRALAAAATADHALGEVRGTLYPVIWDVASSFEALA